MASAAPHFQVVMTALRAKQAELHAVLDKLAALDADLAEKTARKESLEAEVELCKVKLDRCVRVAHFCYAGKQATDMFRWQEVCTGIIAALASPV
jgi:multidrug resistance efflux pump